MDDPEFKQKYEKYKLRVKLWEHDFKKKYNRVPSKYDIHDAAREVRDAYKMYYKLKTSFLEDTLSDVFNEDGFNVLEMTQSEELEDNGALLNDNITDSVNGGPRLPIDIAAIIDVNNKQPCSTKDASFSNLNELPTPNAHINLVNRDENHVIKNFEAVEELEQNQNAWDESVSKRGDVKTAKTTRTTTPFMKLNPIHFHGVSFTKRNPRIPLKRNDLNKSINSNLNNATTKEADGLIDFELFLIQRAKRNKESADAAASLATANNSILTKDTIKTQVDEGWLERTTAQNAIPGTVDVAVSKRNAPAEPSVTTLASAKKTNYGLNNIDVTKLVQKSTVVASTASTATAAGLMANAINLANDNVEHENSDSVVEESDNERESEECKHIVKRRRLMRTDSEISNTQTIHSDIKDSVGNDIVSDKNVSAAEDQDPSYVPEESKSKRKKVTAKRTKTVKDAAKIKTETRVIQPKSKTKKKLSNIGKCLPRKTTQTKGTMNTKNKSLKAAHAEIAEEVPLNPADLKYALALDQADITSAPRIEVSELEQADRVAQIYINNFSMPATAATTAITNKPLNEKREALRKKLEKRIASGKLNENFVRINIEKKKYVRGKKSINYSNYKKQQWKHKKRIAALSGPNMDMGGCDGGVINCFSCGGVGHFARDCKIKGDALLPLSAQIEEDPSPFPTLEEAEQMATQNALAVHSRNIGNLPGAANAALYRFASEEGKASRNINDVYNFDDNDETDEMLKDMDAIVAASVTAGIETTKTPIKNYVGHKIPENFLKKAGLDKTIPSTQFGSMGALYDLNTDGSVKPPTAEVLDVLHMFGHANFRKGQDRAIMRILSGLSTLVILSTGSGKSLCYQLPAYMYSRQKGSITLVISPLVSLMEDQVTGVPHFLRAHCLHTNQTPQQRLKVQELIAKGEVDILLVSPEAVVAGERATGFGVILRQLPPIAFACIDEVHCVSQWSHNFRPSYLMICKVLKKNLGVQTVLGLTATATLPTRNSIINHLGVSDGECGIISDIPLPDNLILSVSKDENRDVALLGLLDSERFAACQSIIIYCTRRDDCERIASFIRTYMQDRKSKVSESAGAKKRKRVNWHAEPYHAGMPASRRSTIQNAFMRNELRIVVATIAFGMGINKPDIRAVIHYNMPRNFESYVQEIGRAGRDGLVSHCHLFLDANDQNELRRHIYANSIDRHVIRKLLKRIFVPCSCDKNVVHSGQPLLSQSHKVADEQLQSTDASDFGEVLEAREHICPGHEIGFSVAQTVEALDIPAENISTLLCYMELDTRWNMNVLSSSYIMAKVISYGGSKYLKHAAKECPPLAMAIALQIKNKTFKEDANLIEFSVVDIAAAIGWNSGVVKYQLKNLEWLQVNGYPKRSPITVTFSDLGFRIKAPGDFTIEEIDAALDALYSRTVKQEHTQLIQLQYVYSGLAAVAYNTFVPCANSNFSNDRSEQLKAIVRNYFQNDYPKDLKLELEHSTELDELIINDIHKLISIYPDTNFTGRNIARIFHGIPSPNFPAVIWGRCKYWRTYSKANFNRIVQLANAEIVKRRI